jgi:hypothetical protein
MTSISPPPLIVNRKPNTVEQAHKVAQDYETMVFGHFVKGMFVGLENSTLFGDSHSAEIVKGWFVDAIAKSCPNTGLGLANKIAEKIVRDMENNNLGGNHDITA